MNNENTNLMGSYWVENNPDRDNLHSALFVVTKELLYDNRLPWYVCMNKDGKMVSVWSSFLIENYKKVS